MSTGPSPELLRLATAIATHPATPERILVVECGEGEGVLFLAREFPSARVRGVDASVEAIRAAVARIGLDPEGRVAFKAGRARSLPYPDDMFDLLAQVRGKLHAGEAARVLRPGGRLLHVEAEPCRWSRLRPGGLRRRLGRHGFELADDADLDGQPLYAGRLCGG